MSKKLIAIIAVIVIVVAGIGGWRIYSHHSKQKEAQEVSNQIQDYYNTPAAQQTTQHIAEANKSPALKKSAPGSVCRKMGFAYEVPSGDGSVSCTHGAD